MTIKDAQGVLLRGGKIYHRSFAGKAYLIISKINNQRVLAQFCTGNDSTPNKTYGNRSLEQVATSDVFKDGWFELVDKNIEEKIPTPVSVPKFEIKPKNNSVNSEVETNSSDYEKLKPSSDDWDDLKSIFKK